MARIVEADWFWYGSGRKSRFDPPRGVGDERTSLSPSFGIVTRLEGAEGLIDRAPRPSLLVGGRQRTRLSRLLEPYRTRYSDVHEVMHSPEHLVCDHGFAYGYTWTKLQLQRSGLVKLRSAAGCTARAACPFDSLPRHGKCSRTPRPSAGLRRWTESWTWWRAWTIATSEVYSASLVEEERTHSSFRGLQETIEAKGLSCSFYTDRGAIAS